MDDRHKIVRIPVLDITKLQGRINELNSLPIMSDSDAFYRHISARLKIFIKTYKELTGEYYGTK